MACEGNVCGTGGWGGPLPGDPDNNSILSAFGVPDGVRLSWTLPLTNAYAVSFVKVYRGITALFVNSVHIATAGGDGYLDPIPVDEFRQYFYWIKFVSINGTELNEIGPASATPINGFYELAARLSGKIDNSFLAGELRSHLDLIDVNSANIAAEVQNRLSENQAFASVLATVQADVDGAVTLIQSEITERSSADSALVDSVNALAVGLNENAAAIVTEQTARINADGAMASDIQTLFTTVDGINSTIQNIEVAGVGYSVLVSTGEAFDGDGIQDVYSAVEYPSVDFPEYAINRKRIIDSNGVLEWNSIPANASKQVEWRAGLPLASAVKSVVVAGPAGYAGLEQAFLAQQDLNDGFKAMYTAKVDVNGVVGGFGLYNDGATVDALFDVDNFAVGKATQNIKPFIIDTSGGTPVISLNGQVYIGNRTADEVATQLAQVQLKSLVFQRSANRPTTPTGGSFISPVPAGWSDGIPDGTLPVWMATRLFTSDALSPQQAGWTTPEKVGELGTGTKVQFSVDGSTLWHDTPSTDDYYMRTGTSIDGGATWSYAGSVKIKGETGAQGAQGIQGIAGTPGVDGVTLYTWIKYADSPTTGMSDFPSGKAYLGVAYNKSTPTESTTYADYSWSLIQGTQGIQGPAGIDGSTTYTWIKYADSAAGAGMSDSPTGKTYIGIAPNKATATESTTAADYTWALIQGPQGPAGANGAAGQRGSRTFYVSGQSAWNSTLATTTASVSGGPVINDVVTMYGTGFSQTRFWDSAAWQTITVAIDGNLLVTGTVSGAALVANTVTADKIDARGLSIKDASGNVILAAGSPLAAGNITPSSGWLNSNVSIAANGSLSGGGGGQVTIGGLGYTGDLNATAGASTVPSNFLNGDLTLWTSSRHGNPSAVTSPGGVSIVSDAALGTCAEITYFDVAGENYGAKRVTTIVPDRIYKASAKFKLTTLPPDSVAGLNIVLGVHSPGFVAAESLFGTAVPVSQTDVVTTASILASTNTRGDASILAIAAGRDTFRALLRTDGETGTYTVRLQSLIVEDVTDAYLAQTSANAAATNATNALNQLTDIASDAKLTPSEKHDVRREWDVVINEQAGINTNAGLYSAAATANTAYNNALQTLGTYLNNGTAYTLSTSTPPSWINDASLGTTTTIVGATFRSNWQAMYAARQALLNKIAEEAGKVAVWASIGGAGKPDDNATVGATFGVDISGQITAANASTYIANAAIQNAQIANAAITSAKIANAAIGSAQIGNLVVASAHIQDLTVGTGKIADNAVSVATAANFTTTQGSSSTHYSPTYYLNLPEAGNVLINFLIPADPPADSDYSYLAEYSVSIDGGAYTALNAMNVVALASGNHSFIVKILYYRYAGFPLIKTYASFGNRSGSIALLGFMK